MFENISREAHKGVVGIYVIHNVDCYYVGQSVNIYRRMIHHRSALLTDSHDNTYLQRIFNKYKNLEFHVLLVCEKEELNDKEKYYIENYCDKRKCVNLRFDISSPNYTSIWTGKKHKESSKQLMSIAKKGKSSPKRGKPAPKASTPIYCIDSLGVRTDYTSANEAATQLGIQYKTLHQRIKYGRTGRDGTMWFYNTNKVIEPVV
jgi:hypothetical protein